MYAALTFPSRRCLSRQFSLPVITHGINAISNEAIRPQCSRFVTSQGAPNVFPPLTQLAMPDFGWRLNDKQIAHLATFIRSEWGKTLFNAVAITLFRALSPERDSHAGRLFKSSVPSLSHSLWLYKRATASHASSPSFFRRLDRRTRPGLYRLCESNQSPPSAVRCWREV